MIMHHNENKVYCRTKVSNVLRFCRYVRSIVDFQQPCSYSNYPASVLLIVSPYCRHIL